jgi:hypothetical protein
VVRFGLLSIAMRSLARLQLAKRCPSWWSLTLNVCLKVETSELCGFGDEAEDAILNGRSPLRP